MRLTLVMMVLAVGSIIGHTAVAEHVDGPPDPQDLPGVWKLCYHPELKGVSEPHSAYRVLLPDGGYVEFYHGDDGARYVTVGTYAIEGNAVAFEIESKKHAGGRDIQPTRKKMSYRYMGAIEIVVFDDLGQPVLLPVLAPDPETLNHCYAKVL